MKCGFKLRKGSVFLQLNDIFSRCFKVIYRNSPILSLTGARSLPYAVEMIYILLLFGVL